MSEVDKLLHSLGMKSEPNTPNFDTWDKIIQRNSSYVIFGDIGTGKSGLAYWLLEHYSEKYNLQPAVVGLPQDKIALLPSNFMPLGQPDECSKHENTITFIDEADLQLPIEDTKARKYVINFLSQVRQRKHIFILAFHFPRLALGRYLPFFAGFLHKRPPYLYELASKSKGDALMEMMQRAEERFAELAPSDWEPDEQHNQPPSVLNHTYVVAPRIRWQGMIENPLPSFWTQDLSEIWSGTEIEKPKSKSQLALDILRIPGTPLKQELSTEERLQTYGVPAEMHKAVIEMDKKYSLEELREMCRGKGLPTAGDKKKLASILLMEETEN